MLERPRTHYVRTEAGHVAYQVFGDGPPTILFITSWFSNLDTMWDAPGVGDYFDRLSSFARVVCFDKRGSGVSDPIPLDDPPTLERGMDDAVAVLDAVGADRVAVLGDTEGGLMAMLLAATFPDRVTALVLVNSFARWQRADEYPIGMPADTTEKLLERWSENWGVTAEILALTAPSLADDAPMRRWFQAAQRLAMPPGPAAALYRWVTAVDVRQVLGSIRAPTLVLHRREARHHRLAFGRYLADTIPDAHLVELPGADTLPFHAGNVDPLLHEVERFLVGAERPPTSRRRLTTILMSDVVDSTRRAAALGDARWRMLMAEHDRLARELLDRFRGEELAHTGDGIVASFDGPSRAVTCAQLLERTVRDRGLTVRIGLHTGEVEVGPGGVTGLAIHLASRVMAVAETGGIIASRTVKDLAFGSGVRFDELGEFELRGVPDVWTLYRVQEGT
jgi:class 3 adenylate cyclase